MPASLPRCMLPICGAETGEIYHLTFKPPPPEIIPRLVRFPCCVPAAFLNRMLRGT